MQQPIEIRDRLPLSVRVLAIVRDMELMQPEVIDMARVKPSRVESKMMEARVAMRELALVLVEEGR